MATAHWRRRRPELPPRRRRGGLDDLLPAFLAGTSLGLVVGWLVSRRGGEETPPPTRGGRWVETWEEALEALGHARERWLGRSQKVDVVELEKRLGELPDAAGLRVRDLGGGIVEVLGQASDEVTVQEALASLAGTPGVTVVVNRVWTPSSLAPGDARAPSPRDSGSD